jgi:N utilization substance protein B
VGVRREGRELALQALYSMDINQLDMRTTLQTFRENVRATGLVRSFAEELVAGVTGKREEIDRLIEEKSKNWAISRMGKVDLNILRLAAYELCYRSDIPKNVTINEAIEVAKKFGTEESPAFVNGILDEIASGIPEKA